MTILSHRTLRDQCELTNIQFVYYTGQRHHEGRGPLEEFSAARARPRQKQGKTYLETYLETCIDIDIDTYIQIYIYIYIYIYI